jgi:hypothetical protein
MDKRNNKTDHHEKPGKMPAAGPNAEPEQDAGRRDIAAAVGGQGTGRGLRGGLARRTVRQTTLKTSISTAPGNIERQAWT